MHSHKMSYN